MMEEKKNIHFYHKISIANIWKTNPYYYTTKQETKKIIGFNPEIVLMPSWVPTKPFFFQLYLYRLLYFFSSVISVCLIASSRCVRVNVCGDFCIFFFFFITDFHFDYRKLSTKRNSVFWLLCDFSYCMCIMCAWLIHEMISLSFSSFVNFFFRVLFRILKSGISKVYRPFHMLSEENFKYFFFFWFDESDWK